MAGKKRTTLKKELTLFDVYAISTGAMFSSGFFLLPGIAAAETGPSVILAYLVAGLFILPTMISVAELSTAMPRAGGAYYFIDRSLGPLFGTIGGIGTWLALIFKSAFALIGMGAYLAIFIDLPILPVAIGLTIVFGLMNIIGAKESSWLQKVLVTVLVVILLFYVVQGVFSLFRVDFFQVLREEFDPFFQFGPQGFFATIGLVFVSYAGLTKVASVSEEVRNPDRNIPLGMALSLATATFIYVVGVFIMVMSLDPSEFHADLTPVATSGEAFMGWLPGRTGIILIVVAAIAAFASTANAGIMSAARYPLAMARDRLIPSVFGKIGRFGTPAVSTLATMLLMILLLLVFNVEAVAKLASAFQLLLFAILNICVIVMRESRIEGYDPGFRSPFYPWMQLVGFFLSAYLIVEMGLLSILFTLTVIAIAVLWYFKYAIDRIEREGAIFHVHARLGEYQYEGLEQELREIVQEKGLRKEDQYARVVEGAMVLDLADVRDFEQVVEQVAGEFSEKLGVPKSLLLNQFFKSSEKALPVGKAAAIKHVKLEKDIETTAALVRIHPGIEMDEAVLEPSEEERRKSKINCLVFLISAKQKADQHFRILVHLSEKIDTPNFYDRWKYAKDEQELKELFLDEDLFVNIRIKSKGKTEYFIDRQVKYLDLPGESLITVVRRKDKVIFPHGNTVLREGDELFIIGENEDIEALKKKYCNNSIEASK